MKANRLRAQVADRTITFFVPGIKVGGTNTLFARLSEILVTRFGLEIAVVDYPHGFVARTLQERRIPHQLYVFVENQPIQLPANSFLVLELSHGLLANRWFVNSDSVRCLLWSLHPTNSLISFPFNYYYRGLQPKQTARLTSVFNSGRKKKVLTLLTRSHRANALAFMDSENYYWNKTIFGFPDEPHYLPVPIIESTALSQKPAVQQGPDTLQLGWLGRLASDKIASLKALIVSINAYARQHDRLITLHVIGSGSQESVLDKVPIDERVTIVRCGTLLGEDLSSYMTTNIHILFGMGTSCLEAGRLWIPTVLIPFDYHEIPLQHFKMMWLYESRDYLLGWHWTNPPANGLQSLEQLLDAVIHQKGQLVHVGQLCCDYVTNHHNIDKVTDQLIDLIAVNRQFSIGDIRATGVLDFTPTERMLYLGKDLVQRLRKTLS